LDIQVMEFVPIKFDAPSLAEYSALFTACFPDGGRFTTEYLSWLYRDNPDGRAFGFDARENGQLAAHYVCVPASVSLGGEPVRVLLSLNTATHPQFQGKGLFTKLAAMTYEAAAEAGFAAIYGVANANSTPGFVRKLGFQLVRPLDALVGVGPIGPRPADGGRPLAFERAWTAPALDWRCANPLNPVLRRRRGSHWQFQAAAFGSTVHAYAQLPLAQEIGLAPTGAPLSPLRLYLGLMPDHLRAAGSYVAIPQRLRPSPLNLIFRSLASPGKQLDATLVNFSFLDFDAY
jgi:GNAT superfamily N-acetyltransferase